MAGRARGSGIRALTRIVRGVLGDSAGNTLAITVATIMLLLALVGSGTDMARAYMAKTSLQNACDAGVLAGRKAMSKTGSYLAGGPEQAKAIKMFKFNFNPLVTGVPTPAFVSAANSTGQVTGTATASMPTVLLELSGVDSIPLTVNCSAELQMASADVMFVLDTTGSMAYDVTNTTCCNQSNSKIVGLRNAVKAFYTTVAGAVVDKDHTRVRFGFVPYSSSINVKDLVNTGAMPTSYLSDTAYFQTKLGYFNTAVTTYPANTPTTAAAVTETYSSNITSANCTKYGGNTYPTTGINPVGTSNAPPTANTSTLYAVLSWTKVSGSGTSALGTCKRTKTITTTTYATVTRYKLTSWRYAKSPAAIDVSAFKGFGSVALATSVDTSASTPTTVPNAGAYDLRALAQANGLNGVAGVSTANYTWNGCIEERSTVQQLSMSPVPSGAKDLDLESAPVDDATRWKMYLEPLEWYRSSYTSYDQPAGNSTPSGFAVQSPYCPVAMKQFTTVDTTNPSVVPSWLDTYLTSLVASGATYHDIGMIWAGRLGSPNGMFSSNVNADQTTYPSISRHVIFMTDGTMEPTNTIYNAYGTEYYDNRIAPSGATSGASGTLANYHNNRFLAVCDKLKQMGYTIWVIGFGQTLTTPMQTCATAGRAYYASNTTELTNRFKFIAGQVADLRINK